MEFTVPNKALVHYPTIIDTIPSSKTVTFSSHLEDNLHKTTQQKQLQSKTCYKTTFSRPSITSYSITGPFAKTFSRPSSWLFTYDHKEYLLIAGTFSKYLFVYQTSFKSADSIIRKLQNLISQCDPPKRFISDNGPSFSSGALQKFLALQYINHIISSPHYPNQMVL